MRDTAQVGARGDLLRVRRQEMLRLSLSQSATAERESLRRSRANDGRDQTAAHHSEFPPVTTLGVYLLEAAFLDPVTGVTLSRDVLPVVRE